MAEGSSVPEQWYSWDDWLQTYAVNAAITESSNSNLPGRENGPADAYRHLLWSAELTRRFGERRARQILGAHEIDGRLRGSQSRDAEKMDRHNNELGIVIGKNARAWNDVIKGARTVLDRSDRSGAGGDGQAKWLPPARWRSNPVDDATGKPVDLNWPDTDWVRKVQRLPTIIPSAERRIATQARAVRAPMKLWRSNALGNMERGGRAPCDGFESLPASGFART
jgi:Domain of unknown function (DUF6973)